MTTDSQIVYTTDIPDLMAWDDYDKCHQSKPVRFRLVLTDDGLEIIGDSPYPNLLEELVKKLDAKTIEARLCG